MGDKLASEYIIRRKQKNRLEIQNKGQMHFCRDILMGHHKEKNEKRLNYRIQEWHTSTPYDIFWNQSTYPTVCLLLDMWQQTDHFITVCGKWVFYSNFEVMFPLTQYCLNYKCRGNDTDENNFLVSCMQLEQSPPEVVERILNMK